LQIVRADADHEPQILALATRTLGWDEDPRFAELYRWKHDRNPFGASPRWVALEGDQVIGFRVFMRWRFRLPDGTTAEAVRAVDTATDPAHQGKGVFRALTLGALDELRDDGVELVFNTPNDQSRPGYLKMGWTELGRPPVAVVPRLRSLPRIARSRTPAELWSLPTDAGEPAGEFFADAARVAPMLPLLDRGGAAWRTDRSPESLAWRYGLEDLRYRVLTAHQLGAAEPGLVVLRVRRRGPSVEATVCEVIAGGGALRRRLLRAALRATGADYALVAASARVDATPALSLATFSPLVTWRTLGDVPKPDLGAVAFSLGDLELF
jgi:GNAT superfamily N-acetyltransferase